MQSIRIFSLAAFAALTAFVGPVAAKPNYLTCTFMIDGTPSVINFTADEASGTVSVFVPSSGHSRTVDAMFTPDQVMVDESQVRWEISRVDLTIARTIKMIDSTDRGQCEIQTAPERAF